MMRAPPLWRAHAWLEGGPRIAPYGGILSGAKYVRVAGESPDPAPQWLARLPRNACKHDGLQLWGGNGWQLVSILCGGSANRDKSQGGGSRWRGRAMGRRSRKASGRSRNWPRNSASGADRIRIVPIKSGANVLERAPGQLAMQALMPSGELPQLAFKYKKYVPN